MVGNGWRSAPFHILLGTALMALGGCVAESRYDGPQFPFSRSYIGAKAGAPTMLSNAEWWKGFKDPVLEALVDVALSENLQLATARARIDEAEANLQGISTTGSITPSASAKIGRESGSLALDFSWLLDPYGARRETIKVARARIEVADIEVNAARLLVLYNLSNAYVDLRYYQRILTLRHQELRARRQTVKLTETMLEANSATSLDILRAKGVVADIQAQLPMIESDIVSTKNQIAILAGVIPGALRINLDGNVSPPRARMSSDVGIPADLLRNRPDIRIAERLYYAAVSETGVARAELYPKLSLTGLLWVGLGRGDYTSYSFGPQLTLPSFPTTSARAGVEAAQSRVIQSQISWKSSVIEAIVQVENALQEYKSGGAAVQASERAVRLYHEAFDLTRDLVQIGDTTLADLITADKSISDANTVLAQNLRRQSLSFIALNVALGSGNAVEPLAAP